MLKNCKVQNGELLLWTKWQALPLNEVLPWPKQMQSGGEGDGSSCYQTTPFFSSLSTLSANLCLILSTLPLCFPQAEHRQSSTCFGWFHVVLSLLCPETMYTPSLKSLSELPFVPQWYPREGSPGSPSAWAIERTVIRAWWHLPPLAGFHRTLLGPDAEASMPFSCSDQQVQSHWRFSRVAVISKKWTGFSSKFVAGTVSKKHLPWSSD